MTKEELDEVAKLEKELAEARAAVMEFKKKLGERWGARAWAGRLDDSVQMCRRGYILHWKFELEVEFGGSWDEEEEE